MSDVFLRTDTESLAVASLEEALRHLETVEGDPQHWLWAIPALKLSLQTLIVGGFGSASRLEAQSPKRAERSLSAVHGQGDYPAERMRDFLDLYAYANGRHDWTPTPAQDEAVQTLNDLRNKIEHFLPGSWSLEIEMIRSMTLELVSVLRFFLQRREYPWFDQELEARARTLIDSIQSVAEQLPQSAA